MGTMLRSAPASLSSGWRVRRSRPLHRVALWLVNLLVVWQQRLEDRERLRTMPPAQLCDTGLDPAEVWQESEKPFWRV